MKVYGNNHKPAPLTVVQGNVGSKAQVKRLANSLKFGKRNQLSDPFANSVWDAFNSFPDILGMTYDRFIQEVTENIDNMQAEGIDLQNETALLPVLGTAIEEWYSNMESEYRGTPEFATLEKIMEATPLNEMVI